MNERIKQIRNALKLTQTDFAEKIGISRSALTKLEAGTSVPAGTTIKAMVREYNVNEQWLREGVGEMFRPVSETEELAKWLAEVNRQPTTSAQRKIARMLTMLDPDDWITIEKMINALKEE